MNRLIVQGNVIAGREIFADYILVCEGGQVMYVGPKRNELPNVVVQQGYIVPGYVDIHIHGLHGFDVMDGTKEALQGIAGSLVKYGVTSFLAARLAAGTLTASTLTLDRAVQNMVQLCNVAIPDAVAMASEIPAKVIGLGNRKGQLAAGYDADFVITDEHLHPRKVFIGGKEYECQE